MNNISIDLNNCDIEPIHQPGQIQSHGFLIVIDKAMIIRFHSDNIGLFLKGLPEIQSGQHINVLESALGKNEPPDFINQLITFGKNSNFDQTNPFLTYIDGKPFYLVISVSQDFYLLEFEPAVPVENADIQKMIGRSISEMLADKNLKNLLNNTVQQIKKVINYDRVMIYQFADDGHGEVVAEAKNDNLPSWLGLHYPASDIPQQARELYKKNLTRLIANVHTQPSKIITDNPVVQPPLDLSAAQLRAVSPIHIQYLKNMEVDSSFSISLIYHEELWGLIACHNYTPRFIDFKARESSKLIGQILSSALEFRQDEENQRIKDRLKASVDELSKFMQSESSIDEALTKHPVNLMSVTDASGAVLVYEKNITQLGVTPDLAQLTELISWIKQNVDEPEYHTNKLSSVYPSAVAYSDVASGMLVSTLSAELGEYAIWFKPEQLEIINWAGNPDKPAEIIADNNINTISPRKSFEVWSRAVKKTSKGWTNEEILSVIGLKAEILYAINKKAGELRILNEKLKQAYEELDTFSFTISHDLKNPLTIIKSYTELLQRDKTLAANSQKMLGKIVEGTNKMNVMIREVLDYSRIGRSELEMVQIETRPLFDEIVNGLTMIYQNENMNVTIGNTPAIKGDPLMVSQIFSNLIGNAVKYSSKSDIPSVSVDGTETPDQVVYCVRDNGVGIHEKQISRVFELFRRLDNVTDFEGSGVGLAIVKRIIEKHRGKVWVESNLGEGSAFFVAFNK